MYLSITKKEGDFNRSVDLAPEKAYDYTNMVFKT